MYRLILKLIIIIICLGLISVNCQEDNAGPNQSGEFLSGNDNRPEPALAFNTFAIPINNRPANNPSPFYPPHSDLQQLRMNTAVRFPVNMSLNKTHRAPSLRAPAYIVFTHLR